ncbi:MAG TPA: hypothetical protein VGJ80_14635 [Gemmatimonadales bacterium]|jgi:hypothetical protein
MCRPAAVWLAVVLLGAPLSAQDLVIGLLQSRADSLLRSWREAQRLADIADSLERERATAGSDTIAVGALRIIANPSPLPLRAAAERAWPAIDSLYGSVAGALTEQPYIIRAVDPDTAIHRSVLHVGLEVPWDLDVRGTTALLVQTVPPPRFDGALAGWLGTVLRPTARWPDEYRAVFLQLVTAPSEAVRSCFLGAIPQCADVLQLNDSAGLLERWYVTPAEREAVVRRSFSDYFARGPTAPALQRCLQHHDDACMALLQTLPRATLPRPLGPEARLALLREALRSGGHEAYARLVADPHAPIATRLASAAGMKLDSLVLRWRQRALAARPAPLTLPLWAGIAALAWTAVFGCCALRSSRWRR